MINLIGLDKLKWRNFCLRSPSNRRFFSIWDMRSSRSFLFMFCFVFFFLEFLLLFFKSSGKYTEQRTHIQTTLCSSISSNLERTKIEFYESVGLAFDEHLATKNFLDFGRWVQKKWSQSLMWSARSIVCLLISMNLANTVTIVWPI